MFNICVMMCCGFNQEKVQGATSLWLCLKGHGAAYNNALGARGQPGAKAPEYRQEVILPTCLSLTESVAALAREVSLGRAAPCKVEPHRERKKLFKIECKGGRCPDCNLILLFFKIFTN